MEKYENIETKVPCRHSYHKKCMEEWRNHCPKCTSELNIKSSPRTTTEKCAFCFGNVTTTDIKLSCHSFHLKCFNNWTKLCPVCPSDVYPSNYNYRKFINAKKSLQSTR